MSMFRNRPVIRLDLRELTLCIGLAFAAYATWSVSRAANENPVQSEAELEPFRQKFGPGHFTERGEEWVIRDFFQDGRGGFFVDAGANHYQLASKSYFLETKLGWSGIAIEPQAQYAAAYAAHRPLTKLFPY